MKGFHKGLAEDDLKSKIYDKVLFRRLVAFLKPYKSLVFISFILLLLITGTNLLAPVITQRAVDEVIVSNKNLLEFSIEYKRADFVSKYPRIKFKEYNFNDNYYLIFPNKKINYIPKTEVQELKESGRLHLKIVILQNKPDIQQILSTTEFVEISEDQLVVQNFDLISLRENNDLTKEQLRLLRREDINKLKLYGLMFFIVVFLQLLFTYFQIYFVNYAAQYAMYDLRRDLFYRLERSRRRSYMAY